MPTIMGIVYSPSALLHQRLAKQSAKEKRKHNSSSVNLSGYTRDQIKKRVSKSDQFTASEAAILNYIADQDPDSFVLTVTEARAAIKFGELRWSTARKKLESKGILMQQSVPLDSKSRHWFLDVDFSPLRDPKYDAPPPKKKTEPLYNARAHVIPDFHGINPLRHTPPPPLGGRRECVEAPGLAAAQQATTPAIPPAHEGGGAVLLPPDTINTPKDNIMENDFSGARDFFDFLGRHGVLSVRLAAQQRKKKDGQRGAPLGFGRPGKRVAEGPPVRTAAAADLAQKLLARLEYMGKSRLELITAAAEDTQGLSKSILIDDLSADGVLLVKTKWRGPGAILETSPGNHQAILILAEPMGRPARKSITDQLVELAAGDAGATAAGQLHRFPCSVNYKPSLPVPFTCRLVAYFTGTGEGVQPAKPVAHQVAAPVRPGAVRPMRKRRWASPAETASQEAFRLAVEMLDSGSSGAQVEAVLSSPEWLRGKHSATDWPARTRREAERFRAGEKYGRRTAV